MLPPDSAEVFETATSKYWYVNGFMYVVTKKGTPPDLETHIKDIESFKKRAGNKKVCAIMEINESTPTSKEVRDYNSKELAHLFKAVAFIIHKPLMKILASLYLGFTKSKFPIKMCSDENEAREWIKQYL